MACQWATQVTRQESRPAFARLRWAPAWLSGISHWIVLCGAPISQLLSSRTELHGSYVIFDFGSRPKGTGSSAYMSARFRSSKSSVASAQQSSDTHEIKSTQAQ